MKKNLVLLALCIIILGACTTSVKKKFDKGEFKQWAQTPPMGWNSWDCYGPTVEEHEVKANTDYMAEHLKEFGWEYIVVDIRWFVENDKAGGYNQTDPIYVIDEYGRYMPAINRFPSASNGEGFKDLADYVHDKGLKFGIHIMRGIPKYAVDNKLPVKGTDGITADQIYSTELQCTWLRDNYTIVADKPGAQEYYNSIFELYASWGVDFIKIDDLSRPYHKGEIELIRNAIDNCGREIVLSTSPGETPITAAEHVSEHANMWRMVDDVWDTWPHVKHLLDVTEKWYPYIAPGTWPDCDMLPLGRISIRGERGKERMSRLTKDEQYTLMTLWTIFRSPLMFGGDLPSNDDFTLSLLTNKEALHVLNKSTNNKLLVSEYNKRIWVADDTESDDKFVAFFGITDQQPIDESLAIYSSETVSYEEGKQQTNLKVKLKGAKKLFLVVTDNGDGSNWDHADWIEPKLIGPKGTLDLTEIPWVRATTGYGTVTKNRTVMGRPLIVNDQEYPVGIGTHANSVIEYDIPEGYDTFTAMGGLDKECISHTEGATVKFQVYTQYPSGSEPVGSVNIDLDFEQLGLKGDYTARDLWAKEDIGDFTDSLSLSVKNHGARLIRLTKNNKYINCKVVI
ncbi:NPCBM/NEW2 domain-containing protein [Plebeiibacterium sediminum]|uniref:Alpha-galactosidase n=1 Tax=Plebeiibacterium sediminum TaxID=2992112 RepID=A0AAE3SFM9_9BACT|nr:NPCBM/NEW2 domain-containing protein [Plebeiobacterium sediminum]MCW3787262.1 NPCBM/NEW2 domain-containing protein [Plebeiobacterium sediminum]